MSEINPRMICGAYCAHFRVSFYWTEADDADGLMPSVLTESLTPFLCRMSGTNQRQSCCAALSDDIGDAVRYTTYESRPSSYRELVMSGENGEKNDAYNRAWARYGLSPLRPPYEDVSAPNGVESATRGRLATQPPVS